MRIILSLLLFFFAETASAGTLPDKGDMAFGPMVGTVGSYSGKYWFNNNASADLGIEYLDIAWRVVYFDASWHFPTLFGSQLKLVTPYVSAGAGMGFWNRAEKCGRWDCSWKPRSTGTGYAVIVRFVAGAEWYPANAPRLGVFAEFAPSFLIDPSGKSYDWGIGARYYF